MDYKYQKRDEAYLEFQRKLLMSKKEKDEKNRDIQRRGNKAPVAASVFEYAKEQKE